MDSTSSDSILMLTAAATVRSVISWQAAARRAAGHVGAASGAIAQCSGSDRSDPVLLTRSVMQVVSGWSSYRALIGVCSSRRLRVERQAY